MIRKNLTTTFAAFGLLLCFTTLSYARPVSYPDGWTFMQMNDGDRNAVHMHYSPTAKYSIGYKGEYWRDTEMFINAVQLNNLVKRWNTKTSQANFYFKSGVGVASSDKDRFDSKTAPALYTGIALDWETRRYFTSYENRYTSAGKIDNFFSQSARVGIAPYIGDYGDLHTWLMLEADHNPERDDAVTITPLVRFFKGSHLAEIGYSTNQDILFNWVSRF